MTAPRRHLPGQVVMLTRRTVDRRYFLRPDAHACRVVIFELAKAAQNSDMTIHALMTMSNHPHIIATDNRGDRSDFMRDFCAGVARSRNRYLRRRGRFWDNQQFGDTVLLDRDAIERKMLYTWLNPVTAGIVARAEHAPGPKILPRHWGKTRYVTQPQDGFYNPKKAKIVPMTAMPPAGYEHMTLEEVIAYFEKLLRDEEDAIAARRKRKGKRLRGPRWMLKQNPFDHPRTSSRMMKLNPRFATRDGALMGQAKAAHVTFQNTYRTCRQRWMKGENVEFPAGTIRLRKIARIRCCEIGDLERALMFAA